MLNNSINYDYVIKYTLIVYNIVINFIVLINLKRDKELLLNIYI